MTSRRRPSACLVLVLATLVAASTVRPASAATWRDLGPPGATVTALARSETAPARVYAGVADGGVYRSDDGGLTWAPARGAMATVAVHALAVDPTTASTVLAGVEDGIYRSDDGGATWVFRDQGLPVVPNLGHVAPVLALAIDPSSPETVYAATGLGVSKSTDGGLSWVDAGSGLATGVEALAIDPSAPATLYAGTASGPYRSDDGGASWHALTTGAGPGVDLDAQVVDLAVPATAVATVYAALDAGPGAAVARSDDGGATWSAAADGLPGGVVLGWRLALDPAAPATLYAASDKGVYRSDDGAEHWREVHGPFPRARGAETALALPGGAVLVGLSDFVDALWDGLLRSPDGGASWTTVRDGLEALGLEEIVPDPRNDGRLHALSFDGHVWRSLDAGATWSVAGGSLAGVALYDLAVDPLQPERLYASSEDSSSGVSLYRSLDGGTSWQAAGAGLPCCSARLAPEPTRPAALYALPLQATRIYRSTDGGAHWTAAGTLPVAAGFVSVDLQVDPHGGSSLYVLGVVPGPPFCGAGCAQDVLLRSDDGGGSWSPLDLPGSRDTTLVRVDPRDASVLFLQEAGTLYRSADRGRSWSPLAETPLLTDLEVDPRRPGVLYQATLGDGVFVSMDGGATWEPLGSGLASPLVRRLSEVTQGPDLLFAATDGGAWARTLDIGQAGPPGGPPPPVGPIFTSPAFPGFRFQVRITADGDRVQPVRKEAACLPETLCVSGAVPGRSEVFVRIVGPKPNGRLWPTIVKLTTSEVEVWIEQTATNTSRYYRLAPASPGVDELQGLFDRNGFPP